MWRRWFATKRTRWVVAATSAVAGSIIGLRAKRWLLSESEQFARELASCGTTALTEKSPGGIFDGISWNWPNDMPYKGNPVGRSLECPQCERTFRAFTDFKKCPVCGVETHSSDRLPIYDRERAKKLVEQYKEFYRRYQAHRERQTAMGKPDPDEIGAMQGRKEARRLRDLERAFEES